MSAFGVDEGGAYAVLYTVLVAFTGLAFVAKGIIPVPDSKIKKWFVPRNHAKTAAGEEIPNSAEDFFLSARNSATTWTIALSFFASGMGAWVVYGTTEMGATVDLSWLGVIGYSMASACPAVIISLIGPRIREMSGEDAFGTCDFAKERYGRVMQLVVAGVSVFYMFIFVVAELTSISNIYGLLIGKDTTDDSTKSYTSSIGWSVCAFTVFYSTVAGVPASIVTDKVQGVMMVLLIIVLVVAVTAEPANAVSPQEFADVSNITIDGFMAMVTLFLAVASAEMFNQGNWQRVWAAKDVPSMRKGFFLGSFMVFFLMMFFGIMGILAVAKDPQAYASFAKLAYLSFFDLLLPMGAGWNYVVLIFVTCLCASSVDTLQNAIVSVFSHDILQIPRCNLTAVTIFGKEISVGKITTRLMLIGINIPAVFMSAQRKDVLSLFLVADLVCATCVLPVYLGLITEPKLGGIIKPPTELGSVMGCICGISAVLVNGAILGFKEAVNPYTGEVYETGLFSYFWLTNGSICALCGSKTMVTFIITPIVGGVGCILFSNLDHAIRGEAAKVRMFDTFFTSIKKYGNIDGEPTKMKFVNKEGEKDENADMMTDDNVNTDNNI
ncbi:hypothetical protein TrVE_jg32 [Triparma verrucosa]|uniref:Uncharacterized protein n=1 Tax=Triparma verrucosa TaxID=1606542 RepID=A0A9W7FMW7_9STRA|nr:hypothetical protein TrVE_jg32 [Triparma verrucosa]